MQRQEELLEPRRRRLGVAIRELAADLVDERQRRFALERELQALRARLAAYEAADPGRRPDVLASRSLEP